MLLPLWADRIPEAVGNLFARRCRWTVIGKTVTLRIETSDDPYLVGRDVTGIVRACDFATGLLLIQLSPRLDYSGHFLARDVEMVMVSPVLLWHGPARLLCTWAAVRLVDAPSFNAADHGFRNTMATGRLVLRRGRP